MLRQPTAQTSSGPDDQTPPNSAELVSVGKKLSTHQLPVVVPAQATGTAHVVELAGAAGTSAVLSPIFLFDRPGAREAPSVTMDRALTVEASGTEASVLPDPQAAQPMASVTNVQHRRGFHESIP